MIDFIGQWMIAASIVVGGWLIAMAIRNGLTDVVTFLRDMDKE